MTEMYLYRAIELLADMLESNIFLLFIGILVAKDKISTEWKKIILCGCLLGGIVFFFDQIALVSVIKSTLMVMLLIIISKSIYDCSYRMSLLWAIICMAVVVACEFLVVYFLQLIFEINLNDYMMFSSNRAMANVIVKIIELIMVVILYIVLNRKSIQIDRRTIPFVVCVCVGIGLLLAFLFLSRLRDEFREAVNLSYCLLALFSVIFCIILMVLFTDRNQRQIEFEAMKLKKEILEKNLQETKTAYMHWEKSIHDYKNIVLSLHSMLEQSEKEDVLSFLQGEMNQMEKEYHMVHCGNSMLDSVLSIKWSEAEEKGIYVSLQGGLKDELPVSEVDLGRMVGNLMDNAIEGAAFGDGEWKYIEVLLSQDDMILEIAVRNSTSMQDIDFTGTKKDKKRHGLGLQSIREITEKYNGRFTIVQNGNVVTATACIPVLTN